MKKIIRYFVIGVVAAIVFLVAIVAADRATGYRFSGSGDYGVITRIAISVLIIMLFLVLLGIYWSDEPDPAIVAIFMAVFDPNAYKQDLTELVREQTGRELQFHGDVDLTVFPALGMKLGAMSFSNAEGFGALPMVKVSEASISVDLASLVQLGRPGCRTGAGCGG